MWENDPHEYIRKGYDIIEDMYSPRTAAVSFLCELCAKRSKENLPKVMGFLVQILTKCADPGVRLLPATQQPHAELGAALHLIGSLQDKLKTTEGYKEQLEPMLAQHVLLAFSNPNGHVRAKAAWCAGVFAEIEFRDKNGAAFPIEHVPFHLCDCPYSYQKGRLTSALTVCPYIAIYKIDISFLQSQCFSPCLPP